MNFEMLKNITNFEILKSDVNDKIKNDKIKILFRCETAAEFCQSAEKDHVFTDVTNSRICFLWDEKTVICFLWDEKTVFQRQKV